MSVRNIPLADFAETKICYFSTLPNELLLIIAKIIPLKDRLALGDTCSTCRSFVSEKDCLKACRDAGPGKLRNMSLHQIALFRGQNEEVDFGQY